MGNCTQPTQNTDAEQATIPMGSFAKNSFLRRSQSQSSHNNDLNSGMLLNVFIYAKCEGLSAHFNHNENNNCASSATLQTESDLMAS